jgi:hypothetical protein
VTGDPARPTVDLDAVRAHHRIAEESRTPVALWVAVADVPVLVAEIARGRALLVRSRAEHADLLAAARATVAAERDGEREPLWYLRDELAAHGQLPPKCLGALDLLALGIES